MDGAGLEGGDAVLSASFLAGGAAECGSTCGVVSGGCMALALSRIDELSADDPAAAAAVCAELREYTSWFESRFGTTLCRERTGCDLRSPKGMAKYVLCGSAFRCLAHAGPAAEYLVDKAGSPLPTVEGEGGGSLCGGPVLAGIREETGAGDDMLETISPALDGGIGLSGGLCGALAGALLVLGLRIGTDPTVEGVSNKLKAAREGLKMSRIGGVLPRRFEREFGSLECRTITGRSFDSVDDLAGHIGDSDACRRIVEWCATEGAALIP